MVYKLLYHNIIFGYANKTRDVQNPKYIVEPHFMFKKVKFYFKTRHSSQMKTTTRQLQTIYRNEIFCYVS